MLVTFAVLVTAALLLAFIARKVAARETTSIDQRVREVMQARRSHALDVAVKPITLLSIPLLVFAATAALAWWLYHIGRHNAALATIVTPVVAAALGQAFTSFFPQPTPPETTEKKDGKPPATFPSGHTTGVTAEALAIAFVLSSEQFASPVTIALLLACPVLVGVTRLYRDKHWFSDTVAGWLAGTAVAAISVLLYQARFL